MVVLEHENRLQLLSCERSSGVAQCTARTLEKTFGEGGLVCDASYVASNTKSISRSKLNSLSAMTTAVSTTLA